ncbi:hypothetical protein Y032_0326g2577 [Ancylostoma ceylanicum]|uniref:Uncharacterized protein n=1 Tax=Ancylostoma ceylanicum TaxID=53326 RepID=A0A016S136_9BILA|nr:hypothetical protein Y032_0326g2577 [Ancylostoma ceylanicum]
MAVTQARRVTAPRAPELMSFAAIMLLLVMKHEESGKITKSGRKVPRNSTPTADDNDSGACGAVARCPCRGHGWVNAIDAHRIWREMTIADYYILYRNIKYKPKIALI